MTQHKTQAGSRSQATGKKRVTPGFEAREVGDTLCTNAAHGKCVLTPFLRTVDQHRIGLYRPADRGLGIDRNAMRVRLTFS